MKHARLLSMIGFGCLFALLLTACAPTANDPTDQSEPSAQETAAALAMMEQAGAILRDCTSYTKETTLQLSGDGALSVTGTERTTATNWNDITLVFDSVLELSVTEETEKGQSLTSIREREIFKGNKMVYSYEELRNEKTVADRQLFSSMNRKAFREYRDQLAQGAVLTENTCAVASRQQNADGTWSATYSGLSGEGAWYWSQSALLRFLPSEITVADVTLTIQYTADGTPIRVECIPTLVSSDAEATLPTVNVTTLYKDVNATSQELWFSLDGYTEVSGLHMARLAEALIANRLSVGELQVSSDGFLTYFLESTRKWENIHQTLTVSHKGGAFSYSLTESGKVLDQYENGNRTTTRNGQSLQAPTTETAAMLQLLRQLSGGIGLYNVAEVHAYDEIAETADGVGTGTRCYEFTMADGMDENARALVEQVGGRVESAEWTITLKITNGQITACESIVDMMVWQYVEAMGALAECSTIISTATIYSAS